MAVETFVLTTPIQTTELRVSRILFQWEPLVVEVVVRESAGGAFLPAGRERLLRYDGVEAETMLAFVNIGDFSGAKSLLTKTLEKLAADGKLPPGTVVST